MPKKAAKKAAFKKAAKKAAFKKAAKKAAVLTPVAPEPIGEKLTPKQDMFCMFFVVNDELRGNATMSYAAAYGYELDDEKQYPRDDAVYDDEDDNEPGDEEPDERVERGRRLRKRYGGRHVIMPSSYDRAINVCAASASPLLRNPKVQERIVELRRSLLTDEIVDSQLARWINHTADPHVSLGAIKEYNKLRSRVKDVVELTGPDGGPVQLDDARKKTLDGFFNQNARAKS